VLVNPSDIQRRFRSLAPFLDERMRRLVAASESKALGYGGVSVVARETGVSRRAITEGMKELKAPKTRKVRLEETRIRRRGAGRKRTVDKDSSLLEDLDGLVDPVTRGDPESPLRWTCKSVRRLAEELQHEGHAVSYQTVAELLHALDYSLQANQKTLEGSQHADRDEQFEYINRKAQRYLKQGEPVISVDTKKKELVGDFKNAGRKWELKGQPEEVRVHDFEIRQPDKGKVAPYGVYDLGRNVGWVSVGVDHDTAAFAVESIRRWWRWMGTRSYPQAKRLLITADSGGSKRRTGETVEVGIAETGRRNRVGDFGLSLPAGHEQVEQDRTPAVLFHQPELARQTANQSRGHHQPHCGHYHRHWLGGEKQARHQYLSCGLESFRPTDGRTPAQERQVSWRLELQSPAQKLTHLFSDVDS